MAPLPPSGAPRCRCNSHYERNEAMKANATEVVAREMLDADPAPPAGFETP